MKRRIIMGVAAAALAAGVAFGGAGTAGASPERTKPNTACMQAGIGTLQSLGLLPTVAKNGIEVVGVGVVRFPTVLKLHRTNPELFQTGGVSVVVPGVGEVPATWCDGSV
jgi:hypothetical protein